LNIFKPFKCELSCPMKHWNTLGLMSPEIIVWSW